VGVFFDSARKEECSFTPHASGGRRCLPLGKAVKATYYTADCTGRLLYVEPNATPPEYILVRTEGAARIHLVGAPHTGSAHYWQPKGCVEISADNRKRFFPGTFYTLGAEIPASEFESGELKHAE
jgi:hypothetical protein